MPTAYRALGTIVKVTSTATLTIGLRLDDGAGNTLTLDSGEAAYGTIAAGSYRLPDFAQLVASKLLAWVTAAKAAAVTATTLTSTGSPSVTLTFTPSTSAGGSLFSLAIGPIGATFTASGQNAAIVTHADTKIDNATDAYGPLGLVYETATGATTRAGTVAAGSVTWAGLWQPRSIFVFDRSEVDEGDAEEETGYKAIRLADGSGSVYASGRSITRRTLRLVDLDESIAGRPVTWGRCSSLGSDRVTFTLPAPTMTTLSGISSPYYQSDLATVGRFVEVGGYVSRLRTAHATAPVLCEEIPSSITVNSGTVLNLVSEVHALWTEAKRLGYLVVYDVTDSDGSIRWTSSEYMLDEATARWGAERRDLDNPLYSFSWGLVRRDKWGLQIIS